MERERALWVPPWSASGPGSRCKGCAQFMKPISCTRVNCSLLCMCYTGANVFKSEKKIIAKGVKIIEMKAPVTNSDLDWGSCWGCERGSLPGPRIGGVVRGLLGKAQEMTPSRVLFKSPMGRCATHVNGYLRKVLQILWSLRHRTGNHAPQLERCGHGFVLGELGCPPTASAEIRNRPPGTPLSALSALHPLQPQWLTQKRGISPAFSPWD